MAAEQLLELLLTLKVSHSVVSMQKTREMRNERPLVERELFHFLFWNLNSKYSGRHFGETDEWLTRFHSTLLCCRKRHRLLRRAF